MKLLVVTRADKNIESYTKYTIPVIEEFSKKWNADFKILDHDPPFLTEDNRTHYRILMVKELLKKYDRVLCLDADMIINKICPNPFEEVPCDKIGTIYEDVGSRSSYRHEVIRKVQNHFFPNIGWSQGYTNAGTFLMSKEHKSVLEPVNGLYYVGWGSADVQMGYNIKRFNIPVHELSYKWNHMTMFSEAWMGSNKNRFNSYIIHYAGNGVHEGSAPNKLEQIKQDYNQIYGSK